MADDPYTTKLDRSQEIAYGLWKNRLPEHLQNEHDYDLRGAFLSNAQAASNGHLPDTFKKPNHITFSDQSQYSTPETPGGSWHDNGNGSWMFAPSEFNLQNTHPNDLLDYFNKYEKDSSILFPYNYRLPKGQ